LVLRSVTKKVVGVFVRFRCAASINLEEAVQIKKYRSACCPSLVEITIAAFEAA
jgi:hypothetical protein